MSSLVITGAQWGDEGKGKIVDWLSERAEVRAVPYDDPAFRDAVAGRLGLELPTDPNTWRSSGGGRSASSTCLRPLTSPESFSYRR